MSDMACNPHSTDSESVKPRPKSWPDPDRLRRNIAATKARRDADFLEWADSAPLSEGLCYFVSANEHGAAPTEAIIKIGFSKNVKRRVGQLRGQAGGLEVILLATARGGIERERHYHKLFSAHANGGEWFEPHPDILAEIARLNATPSLSPSRSAGAL